MMNNNGGFESYYPKDQGGTNNYKNNSLNRSNTFIPSNPYQNPDYYSQFQNQPPQNFQYSKTNMNQQPPPHIYPLQSQPMNQQNPYNIPNQNQMNSNNPYFQRSNTFMPQQGPYLNNPNYPPQSNQQGFINPPNSLNPIQRSNTYCQEPPRRQTIYDTLDIRPRRFAPDNNMNMEQFGRKTNYNNDRNFPLEDPMEIDKFGRMTTYNDRRNFSLEEPIDQGHLNRLSSATINNVRNSSYFNDFPGSTNFNPEADCLVLRNAVHGWGTDEKAIISIIVNRNAAQRAEIRRTYKACFGKDLIKRLKEDTSGNFKDIICAMFMTPPEYDAYCLYKAMKGLGTNEGVLIEIIGTRNNEQLQEIKDIFEKEYKNTLENWVKGDTSGNFRLLLIALLQCNRSNNPNPDLNACQADADALYRAGEGRWGTDEATFIRIFANRSAAEIACINQCYLKMRGKGILNAIDKEFSGDVKKLLQTIIGALLDIHGYFAMRIRESVKGLGTNDSKLVRVIVSRCEIDLPQIKQAYQRIYQRNLLYDVRDDTSGYYRDILTNLISRC